MSRRNIRTIHPGGGTHALYVRRDARRYDPPLQTNTLTGDTLYFSDSQWTNYPARFYRLRWP